MASSPPAPFPTSLPNPKKRPSMSSQVSATSKRPKVHPLRQTSFPANHDASAYASAVASAGARSETGSIAASTFSTMSQSKQPRGRGRPRKSLQVPDDEARNARETGGKGANKTKSVVSAGPSHVNAEEEPDEEDEDDEALDEIVGGGQISADAKALEDEKLAMFTRMLTSAQSDRFAAYRSGKLGKAAVRRIINQTVSQSVNEHCVSAVMFAGKAFSIEIIERAREVQKGFAMAKDVSIRLVKQELEAKVRAAEADLESRERVAKGKDPPESLSDQERRAALLEIKRLKDEAGKYRANKHRGGLLPDHLREALRRYKADRDGGGVGFDGLSHPLLGVKGSKNWRAGDGSSSRRLFR